MFVSYVLVEFVSRGERFRIYLVHSIYWSDEEAMSFYFWLELLLRRFVVVVLEVLGLFRLLSSGGVATIFVIIFIPIIHSSSLLLEVISTLVTKVLDTGEQWAYIPTIYVR